MEPHEQNGLTEQPASSILAAGRRWPVPPDFLPDAVLGGVYGCVTTSAVVAGALGAGFSNVVVMVLGVAGLAASGLSMAIGNYRAARARLQQRERSRRAEEQRIRAVPEDEREEIRRIFLDKGFENDTLERAVDAVTTDRQRRADATLAEERGLSNAPRPPHVSAGITFLGFFGVGIVPLLPFPFTAIDIDSQFVIGIALAGVMFYGLGLAKGWILGRSLLVSALDTLLTGTITAAIAYAVGYGVHQLMNV